MVMYLKKNLYPVVTTLNITMYQIIQIVIFTYFSEPTEPRKYSYVCLVKGMVKNEDLGKKPRNKSN